MGDTDIGERRWIVSGDPEKKPYRTSKGFPQGLRKPKRDNQYGPYSPGGRVVLDMKEIDEVCGGMTIDELLQKILYFRRKSFDYPATPQFTAPSDRGLDLGVDQDQTRAWLNYFIEHNHTFGIVHAWATACSFTKNLQYRKPEEFDESLLQLNSRSFDRSIGADRNSVKLGCPPRRIWDVCSHRVIPWEWFSDEFERGQRRFPNETHWPLPNMDLGKRCTPISHSWSDDRELIMSPVNNYQWPIPVPKGVTLEALRQQLVKANVAYTWLDIICLRQEFKENPTLENLRLEEWKVDIPTIGCVYKLMSSVIIYLNGLGQAYTGIGLADKRHWLNRMWTYQETHVFGDRLLIGGGADAIKLDKLLRMPNGSEVQRRIQLATVAIAKRSVVIAVLVMRKRHATNYVDMVASIPYASKGLDYQLDSVPLYNSEETQESAWQRLMAAPAATRWAPEMFKWFPFPSSQHWFPSWAELKRFPATTIPAEEAENAQKTTIHAPFQLTGFVECMVFRKCRVRTSFKSCEDLPNPLPTPPLFQGLTQVRPSGNEVIQSLDPEEEIPLPQPCKSAVRTPDAWKQTNIPVFHITHRSRTITLCEYHDAMFPALTTFLDQALLVESATAPSLAAPSLPKLFPDLLESQDYTIVLLPNSSEADAQCQWDAELVYQPILVICTEISVEEPSEAGAPTVFNLRRVTTLDSKIGNRKEVYYRMDEYLGQPEFVLGDWEQDSENVRIYIH